MSMNNREEKKMAKRVIGVLLVITALGAVLPGIKAGGSVPENKKSIEDAVMAI